MSISSPPPGSRPSPGETLGTDRLFDGYSPPAGVYDELMSGPGQIRAHWRKFLDDLGAFGLEELIRRRDEAERLVHENGVTYSAHGDPQDLSRPWHLDLLPLLLTPEDSRMLSVGLIQRANLLNAMLADLYGPQRLLADGLLPPELLFAHPSFQRPFYGQKPPAGLFLHLYAADLARGPDGQWVVAADRTDAPSGAGYALENRVVISRLFPHTMHECQVQRLAAFFSELRETLRSLAPAHGDNPRIVLLSRGPQSRTYFEDVYLARYLGYTLVEGEDLAVRNEKVMLKTLGGLLPVDVILRRIDDRDADPLELPGDSGLGAAGLLQAARSGHVTIANALGSSLVESPAFMAYLPSLCRALLGEELKIPSLRTWWCGDREHLKYVLDNLDKLDVKSAFRDQRDAPPNPISRKSGDDLAKAIQAAPHMYVAQEKAARSVSPVWSRSGVQASYVALRSYLVASGNTYSAMGGGLIRVSSTPFPLDASITAGEASKDVWLLSDEPVRYTSLLQPPGQPVEIRRSGAQLPSRVADNLYWFGRQIERADGAARLIRSALSRLSSESDSDSIPELPTLLRGLADRGQIEPGFIVEGLRDQLPEISRVLPQAVFDENQPGSLRSAIQAMHRAASVVRDRISLDGWRIVNRVYQDFQPPRKRGDITSSDVLAKTNQAIIDLAALNGLAMESMTRGQGWRFLDIGRRLERALHTIMLLRDALAIEAEAGTSPLEATLEVADSLITYRSRYLTSMQLAPVLDLLLVDETNPRSVAFQLLALADHVENLPRDKNAPLRGREQRLIMSSVHSVRMIDHDSLRSATTKDGRSHMDRLLGRLATQLPALSDAIVHKYLIHAGPTQQLTEIRPSTSM